jgi:Haem-binding domain
MRWVRPILPGVVACVVVASIATWPRRSERFRTPLLAGAKIDPRVRAVFERSCRDCHSEATRYPWYSYIAPASWLVRRDVMRGRERLNLSKWDEYSLVRRERCLSEIANQVQDRDMPLRSYTFIHRSARLSAADINAIFTWTQTERRRLIFSAAR